MSAAYAGKRWTEVTLEDVMRGREIALLTAAAWRYYLPALGAFVIYLAVLALLLARPQGLVAKTA